MADPYKTLGVDKGASQDEIKKVYRRLAKKLHPDLHPGDTKIEDRFKTVSTAYSLLSDPELRARYDRGDIDASGQERPEQQYYRAYAGGGEGAKYARGASGGINFEDILSEMFAARGEGMVARGQDTTYRLRVGFLEAATGGTKRLTLPDGRSLDVTIPAGVKDRQTIRLKGQGSPGFGGGEPGDALIKIAIQPHPDFDRKGLDIHAELPITLVTALLGGKVNVPTIHGAVSMTVAKGANSGDTLRLKGKGIHERRADRRGDHYVRLLVMLPDDADDALTAYVEKWSNDHPYKARAPRT